ncbi:hypothetical protein RJT34_17266 [Clitoria ternatea]|uniref:ADP-ribosyl cyclase/cyclic ADP-ribose hydrolase n=1 Tax=Clitoria ternatea TaxID=43366 RepID=A0AAN9PEN5_CLITE
MIINTNSTSFDSVLLLSLWSYHHINIIITIFCLSFLLSFLFFFSLQFTLRRISPDPTESENTSSSGSAAEAHSPQKKYDVFINFRGEDTRNTLVSHLLSALENEGIEIYSDYLLDRGDAVWPALASAIEASHISILVFSPNYASSKWCLEELVKIMECRREHGQVVLPLFYEIDPSDVRKQRGSFEGAFAKHVRAVYNNESNEETLRKWRNALREAANISGWDFQSRLHRDDAHFVKNIVIDVLQKLYQRYPNELKDVVGIEKTLEHVELLLESVPKVGIWGMGGIGKTTIARALFAKHFPQYDSVCFLENIRENSEKNGLESLSHRLLSELLKVEGPFSNVGSAFIRKRLKSKKVLIVLDDVDGHDQLQRLCGQLGDLGEDSKLVITTRNKHLLNRRVDKICEVKEWSYEESKKLFILHAFSEGPLQEGYADLLDKAIQYAGGIPLALKILGLHLCNRSPAFWESTLSKLKEYPDEDIVKVLKVSYDGLHRLEKKIFLDIAFFFNLKRKNDVIRILDAFGFYATTGIQILEDKALISIGYNDEILMHDLLIDMGLDIVAKECEENPGRRSRLRGKDVYDVLENNKGTDTVEGIILDLSEIRGLHLHLSADTFNKLSKLRFIQFYEPSGERCDVVYNEITLNSFPDKTRYFQWDRYPFKSFPSKFCPESLVEFHMPHSNVEQLWQGMQDLVNLEFIDLRECKQLLELPDFSRATKLKWAYLSGCESLRSIHPSLLSMDSLTTLLLDGCRELKSLKTRKHFKSLQQFNVDHCSSLLEFSLSSDLIERLDLSTTGVEVLHSTIGRSRNLGWLNLEGLRLKKVPDELSLLTSLKELRISNCGQAINKQKLHVICDGTLPSLQILHLKDCRMLSELPDNISSLSSLLELSLKGSSVKRLPASMKNLNELEILSLEGCRKLQSLPELPPFIKEFNADNCTSLAKVSTLKPFSTQMKGKHKYISFKNGTKLSESSLLSIMEDIEYTMLSAAFHNVEVRCFGLATHSYNYNTVKACFPEKSVQKSSPWRTRGSSINIELPNEPFQLLGFVYCVVLSPSRGMKQHGAHTHIQCECFRENGEKLGYTSKWHYKAIEEELDSDHVFLWYDPFHSDIVIGQCERNVCFNFSLTDESGELDGLVRIKECGVRLIWSSESEFHNFLRSLDLKNIDKVKLGIKLGLALDMDRGNWINSRKLFFALDNEEELEESLKLNLESRHRVILTAIETETNNT